MEAIGDVKIPQKYEYQINGSEKEFLETKVKEHLQELREINDMQKRKKYYDIGLQERLNKSVSKIEKACEKFEVQVTNKGIVDKRELDEIKKAYRKIISPFYTQSWFIKRAIEKPSGHPGDFKIIEAVYDNRPISKGLGLYFDHNFLQSPLAKAIQNRKDFVRNFFLSEIEKKEGTPIRIMDLASGPCREWTEILSQVPENLEIHFIDYDQKALDYSKEKLKKGKAKFEFHNENILKMALRSPEKNKEKYGMYDIIYSVGLYDYIKDKILERIVLSQMNLVKEGGEIIMSFKDKTKYNKTRYDWGADWRFIQRDSRNIENLFEKIGIQKDQIKKQYEPSGVVVFYQIRKN